MSHISPRTTIECDCRFGALYDNIDHPDKLTLRDAVLSTLMGNPVDGRDGSSSVQLDLLAARLPLDFESSSDWVHGDMERILVANHVRVCLTAPGGTGADDVRMTTVSSSEPLIVDVAASHLGESSPESLLYHIDNSNSRDRSNACKPADPLIFMNMSPEEVLRADGFREKRIVRVPDFLDALLASQDVRKTVPSRFRHSDDKDVPLESVFAEAFLYFNHFIQVEDYGTVSQEHLLYFMNSSAAIICPPRTTTGSSGRSGVDILIPVLMGMHFKKENVTAILVHVNIRPPYAGVIATEPEPKLISTMRPSTLGLFGHDSRSTTPPLPPIIRLVFSLTSPNTYTQSIPPPSSSTSQYTSYDIWCAGLKSDTFPVLQEHGSAYEILLLRPQGFLNPLSKGALTTTVVPVVHREDVARRQEELRRRMTSEYLQGPHGNANNGERFG
ncbi:hypothetical protein EUX98_g9198 [Antrodiella citrinella]|uniref:Uncharacterized protein n=1 Tax=Antrodiella citrinella TaxID=2447956 RepID=A0A4S4LWV8_9APHY|nr:hypothetical protein EUX98_g9198 [Antrodiella citrinella]